MKITEIEINENNVKSAADTLKAEGETTARDIKHIFDRLPELIAARHNALVEYVKNKIYTRDEVEAAISDKVVQIGAGDMPKSVYDPDNDGKVMSAENADKASTADKATTADKAAAADNGVFEYIHIAGALAGEGTNGRFKAAVTETLSSIAVNGVECAVKCGEETEIELIADCWYTFILDGTTVNFKSGGGLGNSKLALATATETDVLKGLTFYSGNKELKTGTASMKLVAASYGYWDGSDVAVTVSKAYKQVVLVAGYALKGTSCSISVSSSSGTMTLLKQDTLDTNGSIRHMSAHKVYSITDIAAGTQIYVTTSGGYESNTTHAWIFVFAVE